MSALAASLKSDKGLTAGASFVALFALMALISFVWTHHDVAAIDVDARLSGPSLKHWLGTNHLGRDVFSMIMVGARVSIAVAVFAVGIGLLIGVPLGLLAAGTRGIIEDIVMRMSDVIFAFPALILAILITAVYGPGAINAVIAIGVFNIPVFARLTRGAALPIWTRGYVMSAKTAGKNGFRISLEHVLPNILPVLIVQATVQLSLAVLAEAALSYVGIGAQPPAPSWGRMLAESQTMVSFAPWLAIFPGLAIFLFVFGLNLLGDGLRRRLDPHRIVGAM
ncbi:ABC transporter permease [Hyphococcus luteus]|uniref:Peptide ABC transporter permease n=1 Tax=Hyphococcus luteus TaxID=2058213 RepID=A0A2S7K2S4_9PROT|nr:ABC transporter permease [Marinicaulis flavus]PQA86793.1 peptide ABC transporter permease [Marinicaulis flavus]